MMRPLDYETRAGCPTDLERRAWQERFSLTRKQRRFLTDAFMWQLCRCRSDDARRLLLGVQ